MEKSSYVYIHLKPNGEVFYVGIGKQKNFKRAFTKRKRSCFWKNIVTKHGYEIQILKSHITWEEACEIEKILISWYGRRDCCGGSLVNLTDGGDGAIGFIQTEEQKKIKSFINRGENNYWFGKTLSPEHKRKISDSNFNNMVCSKHPNSKIVLDTQTGIFFNCLKEASEAYDIKYSTLKAMMQGVNRNRTNLVYV